MRSGFNKKFRKAPLNALLPVLLMAQPAFASVRSGLQSRQLFSRTAVIATQTDIARCQEVPAKWQANPFAAFGAAEAVEQVVQQEPALETLAFLAEQGLLLPQAEQQASESGQNFKGRKEFTAFPQGSSVQCDNPARPSDYVTFTWAQNAGNWCEVWNNIGPVPGLRGTNLAACQAKYNVCMGTGNTPPVNTAVPAITGTASVGNALSGSTGTWTDADGDTLTYSRQWYRADNASGANRVAIASAIGVTYTLTTSDAHKYIQLVVTASDGNGGTQTANSTYTQVANTAPVNSILPSISGTATVGNALLTTNGTWSDADGDSRTYSYQWYRADDASGTNVTAIAGANSASYTLTASDARRYLRVEVTADDGNGGTTHANSAYTQVTNTVPVNTVAPSISGTASLGNALFSTTGTWIDADQDILTYTYQWYRADDTNNTNLTPIDGATSANYTLGASDAQKYLRVIVTANDGYGGTTPANSAYTQVTNAAPVNTVAPSISGTATVGNALSSTTGTWTDADGDTLIYTYQWYRADNTSSTNLTAIAGANSANYTLAAIDAHKYLRVEVTANDGNGGTTPANSAYTQVTNAAPVNTVAPSISGTATVGNALSSTTGTWTDADGDTLIYTYQWYRADDANDTNLTPIAGATSASYTLTTNDARKYLRVEVTANDGNSGVTLASSAYTQVTNTAPVNTVTPSVSGAATVGNALSSTTGDWIDPDGDILTYTYQWYRSDDLSGTNRTAIAGATSASYTLTTNDAHKYLRVEVMANDGNNGSMTVSSFYTQIMNSAPTDITLSNTSVNQSSGVNTVVGTLGSVDPDGDTSFTYSLVMGVGDTHNNNFNIDGSSLRLNDASQLAAGGYGVRIGSDDGNGGFFEKALTVTVVDDVAPTAMSITPASGASASDTSVSFTATFSEPVSGVSASHFALSNTGSAAGTITNVSTTGATSVVTVTGIRGVGTLRVDLNAGTNISDAAGNVIAAGFTSGTAHTVEVLAAPDAPIIGVATASDGQAIISFSAPANDGGAAINGYTVTSTPGGITAAGTGSPITVTGLTNGTTYTFTVTATNAVGTSIASSPSNSVTPGQTNRTPTISGAPAVSVKQDVLYSFIPTATDPDGDTLTFSITNRPSWASFNTATGALTGTPEKANVGVTTGIVISVTDGEFSASLPAFNLEVVNVNEAPVAVDDVLSLTFSDTGVYVLDVLANDSDPDGDTLTITNVSTSIGTVVVADNKLHFTAPENFNGIARLEYRISDGEFSAQAKVLLTIEGSNPLAPVISGVDDIRVNASGIFTKVDLGVVTARDVNGNRIPVMLVNGAPVFKSGTHEALWRATDSNGVSSSVTQTVKVEPQVSIGKSRQVTNHSLVTVEFMLNGESPDYPVLLPYTVAGTADMADHDLSDGHVEITSGVRGSLTFNVFANLSAVDDKTVAIALDSTLNLARNGNAVITVTEANLAPEVVLTTEQQGTPRLLVAKDGGEVRVVSQVTDPNGDIVSLSWHAEPVLTNIAVDASVFAFDPALVSNGVYQITLVATDNAVSPLSGSASVLLVVRDSLPVLGNEDSNGNLIPDSVEGFGDSNGNGIPDYLDPGFDCNVMVEQLAESSRFLTEAEPGICVSRGRVALESNSGGLELFNNQLQLMEPDTQARPIGGVFDFVLSGLPVQGESYYFVVPQRAAIPEGAVYRKYSVADGWKNFVQNSANQLFSAPGEQGYCPAPGDASWQSGLNIGHWCVQLLIEDGGPNDADGTVNGRIVDPGGVSVMLNGNTFPVAEDDTYSVMWNQMHVLDVLENDSDADGDTLTITSASALFGNVVISDDGLLLEYTPQLDYLGTDTVTYSISDGLGGSATAQASVAVYENRVPVVSGVYSATTNNRTAIELQVLSVVTDADGDTLTVTAASAQHGSVSIVNGQLIRYTPQASYTGTDVVSFTVSDGRGGDVTGVANVNVTDVEVIRVDNKSSGGALGIISGLFLGLLAFCRRHKMSVLVAAIVSLFSAGTVADEQWSVEAQVGKSKARLSAADVARTLPAGAEVLAYDRRDTSWSLGVNFRLAEKLWLQGHYVDLGDATVSIGGEVANADAFHRAVSKQGALLVEGVKTGLAYTIAESDSGTLSLHFQGGVFSWWGERESRQGSNMLKFDTSDTDVYWGIQGAYLLTEKGGVTVGFNRYHLEGNKVDNISVGFRWYF